MFQCFVNLALRPLLFCGQTNPTGPNPPHCFDQKTVFVPAVFVLYVPNIPIHNEESICVDMRQPGPWGLWLQEVQSKAWTHWGDPLLCATYLSALPVCTCFLGSLGGVSGSPPQRASYWLTRGLLEHLNSSPLNINVTSRYVPDSTVLSLHITVAHRDYYYLLLQFRLGAGILLQQELKSHPLC